MSWWNQVSETVFQGLQVTMVGMLLVFATLGLIIVALVLLTRLPGLRTDQNKQAEPKPVPPTIPQERAEPPVNADQELARVAAIALALVRSQRRPPTRHGRQPARNAWKQYGRAHELGL